jgi:hypothetical protein
MDRHWELRQEFYRLLHRWPVMIVFFAVGCALGWLLSFIWPSYSKAIQEVYVALNPYRAYSDTNFLALAKPKYSNLDSYNYWQMYQLEAAIYRDAVLQETLENLRQDDAYWQNVEPTQLRDMLDVDWRTAGIWRLIAMHPDSHMAQQLIAAWSDVAIKNVTDAVTAARQTIAIDQERQATIKDKLTTWQMEAQGLPPDQPLSVADRWRLFSLTGDLAQFTPAWMALMAEQPSADASPAVYGEWVGRIQAQIDAEASLLSPRLADLEQEQAQLQQNYTAAADSSLGLSPNLEVQGLGDSQVQVVRPTTSLILIGGVVGLLIWVLTQLVIITLRREK